MNIAIISGVLSSSPRRRTLESGSELRSYEVTTDKGDGTRVSVPVVWLDPPRPPTLEEGDEVAVVGVVRRRFFRAGGATQSRTEVAASTVAKLGSTRATKALQRAIEGLSSEAAATT